MAISGIGSNYNNVYGSTYATQKAEVKDTASAKAEGTKNTTNDSVSDYYSYLQKNYDCVKNGNVAISGSYLKECAKNPEKAKELEKNLSFFKEGYERGLKSAQANARTIGARLVDYSESWSIDSTGNVTMQASATVVTDTKGWKELAEEREEKLKEKKEKTEQEEKLKEQREEKQEQLDKLQENMRNKMEETGKEQFGDKFKGVVVIAKNEENAAISKEAGVTGLNMDLKV